MRYDVWFSEHKQTVELPIEIVNRAHKLNDARAEASRARRSATMVPDVWCMLAAFFLRCAEKLLDRGASSYSRQVSPTFTGEPNMLRFLSLIVGLLLLPLIAFAQSSLPASLPADLPTDQALSLFLQSLGGLKGAGALAIAVVVVQAIMLFFRTPLATFAGKYRLLIVGGLSIIAGFVALLATGLDWKLALMNTGVIGPIQVFIHQLVKQLSPGAEAPKA